MSSVSAFDALWQSQAGGFEEQFGKTFLVRDGVLTCQIQATLGAHQIEAEPDAGIVNSWHGHRFITAAATWAPGGNAGPPRRGQQVLEPLANGRFNVYEVVPLPKAREYEPIDAEGFQIDVYTQLLRSNAVQ